MKYRAFDFARSFAALAVALTLAITASPARAADPVFPVGSRVGLVPPPDMKANESFPGFGDPEKNATILIIVLPAAGYAQLEKTLEADALKKQGVTIEKHETIQLSFGKGLLLTGRQVADKTRFRKWILLATASDITALVTAQIPEQEHGYPDSVVRAALASLSIRATVPEEEELSMLPFTVGELAGFHIDGVLRGRALMLSDPPNPAPEGGLATHLMVAAMPGGPAEPDERANFARLAFNEIAGIKDVHVTMFEPLRMGGQPGYQTLAEARDIRTGTDVRVVQWLRFGSGGFLQMIGVARADDWIAVLSRLRAVRDSIEPK